MLLLAFSLSSLYLGLGADIRRAGHNNALFGVAYLQTRHLTPANMATGEPKKSFTPYAFVHAKGLGLLPLDQQLLEWTRQHKNYLAVMCASYMNEDGKVHPLYLRGGLLDESMLEALKARGLDVDLPQTINKWNSLLPRDPPETNDRALLRQYYQRLREADVALLGEIENKVGRTEDARETIWKVFGDAVRQRLMVANLHSYRTPQELMMDFASELSKWMRTKGATFEETLQQQWTTVFKHLVEDVFAQDSDVRDALKESEQTITGWRALVSFFQQSANELEAVMSKMRMWERLLGLEAGLGKRAASDQDKSRDPAGSSDSRNTRRKVLQPSTTKAESTIANGKTDCVPGKAGVKVPCSFLLQFGDCKHNKCPFAHDESALPDDQRQQLVLAGKRVLEKEKKKDHEFKMGGCTWCWMPKSNKDFKTSHGDEEKYTRANCPNKDLDKGSKKERS